MKKLFLIPLVLLVSFCNCNKKIIAEKTATTELNAVPICPDDGSCSVRLLKNKRMAIKVDGIGKLYYEVQDDVNKSIIVYEYQRKFEEGLQDASHREEVIFEIDNNASEINLSDTDLQQTQMLFGRHCFCKGQAGFFRIKSGKLNLTNKLGEVKFNLDFKINEVPQTIYTVQTTVSIK